VPVNIGLGMKCLAKAVLDATSGLAVGAHGLGVTLPANAWVTQAYYDVTTTFKSATDSATIAISIEGANDVVTATEIKAVGDIWDDDNLMKDCIEVGTVATMIKTSVAREITATIAAAEDLTDGYLTLFVEYVVSQA
jgi:hypothetical protein